MKRFIAMLLIIIFAAQTEMKAGAVPKSGKVNSGAVAGLVREYNLMEGFEVVSVGGLGLGLVRLIAKAAVETEEEKAAIGLLDDLRRIIVVDYEDAEASKRESFTEKMSRLLEGAEKIVEVKDEGDTVNIYGTSADEGDSIDDLIVFIPEDCTLVCMFGSISSQKVADLIVMSNE